MINNFSRGDKEDDDTKARPNVWCPRGQVVWPETQRTLINARKIHKFHCQARCKRCNF